MWCKYFIIDNNNTRLTADSNLKVFDQSYKSYINVNRKANIPDTIIVEFRCDRNQSQNLAKPMKGTPIRVRKNSKYINAMSALRKYLIRLINKITADCLGLDFI